MTTVVHVKRSPYDIYIGRSFAGFVDVGLGNPFRVSAHGAKARQLFEAYFTKRLAEDAAFKNLVLKCYGKTLG